MVSVNAGNNITFNKGLRIRAGPVVRIAPGQYSIDDPEAAKIIYGHGSQFTKASSTNVWGANEALTLL